MNAFPTVLVLSLFTLGILLFVVYPGVMLTIIVSCIAVAGILSLAGQLALWIDRRQRRQM